MDVVEWARAHGYELTKWQEEALLTLYAGRVKTGRWTSFHVVIHGAALSPAVTRRMLSDYIDTWLEAERRS